MDLSRALAQFPSVRVAGPGDNEKILEFYNRSALSGRTLRLRSVRSPDFFSLLRFQSDRFSVLIDEDDRGAIRGLATLTHRSGYLAGLEREIAYLGDFRIAFDRQAMKVWRGFYSLLMESNEIPTVTCVIDENQAAQNALIRQRKSGFQYELLAPYRMVNVLGRTPWALSRARLPRELTARRASQADLPLLEGFLDRQARTRAFGYCFASGELKRRLSAWQLKPDDFFILEKAGSLLACFALWSPAPSKFNVIEKLPWHFNFYRPLVHVPHAGSALKTMYLTHLEVERSLQASDRRKLFATLFGFMADEAWDRDWHMVSFSDFPSVGLGQALRGRYLTQEIPMKLFTVRRPGSQALSLDHSSCEEPGFEIALV